MMTKAKIVIDRSEQNNVDIGNDEITRSLPQYLMEHSTVVQIMHNEVLIRKNESTRFAYLVLSGNLMVLNEFADGNYYSFANLTPGHFVSDLEILSGKMVNAVTLIATETTSCLRFTADDFTECLHSNVEFLWMIARGLANGMYATSSERGDIVYKRGISKLVVYISKYCFSQKSTTNSIKVKKTRQEIASEIGTCEKTINRAVAELHQLGFIDIIKGKIVVKPIQQELILEYYRSLN